MLHIYSWNVNGVRAAQRKGLLHWLQETQPDILCLQETKAHPEQLDPELRQPRGYHAIWASAERKGYSGVALFARQPPKTVQIGLGIERFDREGRTIVADFGQFTLINAYFPNGSRDHSRVPFKMAYKAAMLDFCNRLRAQGRALILCGDVNTAHREIDLARPKSNQKTTGFLPQERAWLDLVLSTGYVDAFRHFHPERRDAYTWWAYWGKARQHNVGWRIDYFIVSPDLLPHLAAAEIHPEVQGSDHCPISLHLRDSPAP